ncbi:hypothetical protein ACHAWO_007501 [Cyclotella atomus]|uniref:PHD-type domain-containing protein n=1 Tax=Cyclotella atomus TaxID=382360 RepID=A0ABD3P2U3_9STRA
MSEDRQSSALDDKLSPSDAAVTSSSRKRPIFYHDILQQPNKRSTEASDYKSSDMSHNVNSSSMQTCSIDADTRDWHVEILSGLFLRSSEHEIDWLESEVRKDSHEFQSNDGKLDTVSEMKHSSDPPEVLMPSHTDVLPLIPSTLRDMCKTSHQKEKLDEFERPLLIPKSWRRPTYESLTLKELEHKMLNCAKTNGEIDNTQTGCLYSKLAKPRTLTTATQCGKCKELPQTYTITSILYNECSLSALANWAMMDPPESSEPEVTPDQSSPSRLQQEDWDKYEKGLVGRLSTDSTTYEMPVISSTFRKCGVCNKYGHYELECELLLDGTSERDESSNNHKDDRQSQPVVLEKSTRRFIIYDLAKELRLQRLLESVLQDTQQKNASRCPDEHKSTGHLSNDDKESINQHHSGVDRCNVCKSGLSPHNMLMCDGCDELFHLNCLDPPLDDIPEGEWLCDLCLSYDSDESSVVVIEGCEGFVVEQRKRTVAEESLHYSGVSLGQHKCQWTAALSVVDESDQIIDYEYLQDHVSDGYLTPNLSPGKLCWAKRFDEELDRPDWWPAMIVEPTNSMTAASDVYCVRFFFYNKRKNVFGSSILPYLPYYEDIGYKRLEISGWNQGVFQKALELSVHALGLKTIGQALKVSRGGVQKSMNTNPSPDTAHRLRTSGWRPPIGWERADAETVDDFVILSKDKRSDMLHKCKTEGMRTLPQNAQFDFFLDEVIGGIVSWRADQEESSCDEPLEIKYGAVMSINPSTEMALVRAMPLDWIVTGNLESNVLIAQDLGSTVWMPLSQLRHVSSKPNSRALVDLKKTLISKMTKEISLHEARCQAAAVIREQNTVELQFNQQHDNAANKPEIDEGMKEP